MNARALSYGEAPAPSARVTVGMPVYNGARFLRSTLDHLCAQDFTEFTLAISDNASTDDTQDICTEYASRDARIHYVRHRTNVGVTANFAFVLQQAKTPYFVWAAHDDVWEPTFLSTLVDALDEDDAAFLACCNYDVYLHGPGYFVEHHSVDDLPTIVRGQRKALTLAQLLRFPHPAFIYGLYRTDALRRTRVVHKMGFDWSDLALVNELALLGGITLVPQTLFHSGIAGTSREPYSVADRRFALFQLTYGAYFRRTLGAIARADGLTVRERIVLGTDLARQVLRFIRLHEWEQRRLSRRRVPLLSHKSISFARDEGGVGALGAGWGEPEDWGAWTIDDHAVLQLAVPDRSVRNGLQLELNYRIIPLPEGGRRTVDCLIGETLLERWIFTDDNPTGSVRINVPSTLLQASSFELTFQIHEARTPLELGVGSDTRRLGLGVERLRLA
jgi:glycosyltransferase involved in cell wall biosynthesis